MSEFFTVTDMRSASLKEQRSEFIAFLYPAETAEQAKKLYPAHCEQHSNATHNCYAYILGSKQELQYYSDQGEPSGTAGKPILNMLLRYKMTNVLAVVTRYFGGVKLGVRGLIEAYGNAVEQVILSAPLQPYWLMMETNIECEYAQLDRIKHFLHTHQGEVSVTDFAQKVKATLSYPQEQAEIVAEYLADLRQQERS